MELVEGSTLAERIASGPIPLDESLHIARQIAEALEAAHDKGIVHRDLKPANVKITGEGVVNHRRTSGSFCISCPRTGRLVDNRSLAKPPVAWQHPSIPSRAYE
jgi:serine/threonine protein kinase